MRENGAIDSCKDKISILSEFSVFLRALCCHNFGIHRCLEDL